jgi:hypothetical protein|tara:strand:+ start:2635 stop:3099 length:465 start_codon:yes stop_codon:yes gene_type:complete
MTGISLPPKNSLKNPLLSFEIVVYYYFIVWGFDMARRTMRISNQKARSQRRDILLMHKARVIERARAERPLFSNTSTTTTITNPSEFNVRGADSGYRRETQDYPSNNAIGGSTAAPERFYASSPTITIGQAYNKGNLVVLTNDESKDPRTGKRR